MQHTRLKLSAIASVIAAISVTACTEQKSDHKMVTKEPSVITQMTLEEKVSQLQDVAKGIDRLDVVGYNWWNEGLHGIARAGEATVFPQAIGLAATWDKPLLKEIGNVVGVEARAKFNSIPKDQTHARYYGLTIWSPNVNIFRDPRWGRGQETFGEDPSLTGALAVNFVQGLQGPDPENPLTISSVKHIAAHSGPEGIRHGFDSKATDYDLAATFLPAFQQVVQEGEVGSVMCAYNAIKGVPVCGDPNLIDGTLRDKWGFEGYVVTDCGAVYDMNEFHQYRSSMAENAAEVINAGVDLNCGTGFASLTEAVEKGWVKESRIDEALGRLWSIRAKLGIDGQPTQYDNIGADQLHSAAHADIALEAARKSVVLLKNDDVLPLKAETRLAVIGPNADLLESLRGNYSGIIAGAVTPLEGLRAAFGAEQVSYAQGSPLASGLGVAIPETALKTADGEPGLTATYYANTDFSGEPVATGTSRTVNLDLQNTAPLPELKGKPYSVRWSGMIVPPGPGDYELSVHLEDCWECKADFHDAFTLYVDGKPVVEHPEKGAPLSATVHFDNGEPQPLQLDFSHKGGDWGVRLQWQAPAEVQVAEAIAAAKAADVVVAFTGLSPDLEGEELSIVIPGFDRGDRIKLTLPEPQLNLLKALKTTGKPLVVVNLSGSAVALNWSDENAAAVLEAWYPGESGGKAIADILSGKYNPSGRLPLTVYRSESDLPDFADYNMQGRTHRYFTGDALYPFGHGLSYSSFAYSNAALSTASIQAGSPLTVTLNITNQSDIVGEEVVQAYLLPPESETGLLHELVNFDRVPLQAGETKEISFTVPADKLSLVNAAGKREITAGEYQLFVGGSQPADTAGQTLSFTITGPTVSVD